MKKHILSPGPILLACWLLAGSVQAQTASFTGDTNPTGDFGGRQDINQVITVGDVGDGNLNITGGAVFSIRHTSHIAQAPGSTGTVNVSGGAEWRPVDVWAGQHGTANINVFNGGKIISSRSRIAVAPGSVTNITVDGPGSSWTIPIESNTDFFIGTNGGSATLRVLNGGTVSTTSDIYTVLDASSSVNIEVDGPNSTLRADEWCYLGMASPTSVKITNGALLRCGKQTFLGWGHVSLSGAGSTWSVGTNLDIGRSDYLTNAVLSIGEGSVVELAGNLRLAADAQKNVGSGTLNIEGTAQPGILKGNVIFGNSNSNTINFKHTAGNYQFAPSISGNSGNGSVNVLGTGTTVLTGNNTYTGKTSIKAGVLRAGSATALSSGSTYSIGRAGTLDANNFGLTTGLLTNAGTFTMGTRDTRAVATVNGEYKSYGGIIRLNAVLGDNNSATQKLVVAGNTTGTSTLQINNIGGTGAQTTGNGILVVQVGDKSYGRFNLPAPGYVQAGAYRYTLVKVGRNWYLQSAPSNAKAAAADGSMDCSAEVLANADKDAVAACQAAQGAGAEIVGAAAATASALTKPAVQADGSAADGTAQADGAAALDGAAGLDDIKDGDPLRLADLEAGAVPVPTLGALGMVSLSSIMGLAGLRRARKPAAA